MRTICYLLILVGIMVAPNATYAQFDFSISFNFFSPPPVAVAPPPLPVYIVPEPPDDGIYLWSPGHWRWNGYDYFWVPGTWVQPPTVGVLWTPGYWGWSEGCFAWHEGYWGEHIGFYGGINYGGGYGGSGFVGGGWHGGAYRVNRAVTNVTNVTHVTNVTNVTNNYTTNNTTNTTSTSSFNGGPGGTVATPSVEEQAAASEKHFPPTHEQVAHAEAAAKNPALAASANHGKPSIAATSKAGDFQHGVVAAKQAGPRNRIAEKHNSAVIKDPALAKGAAVPKTDYLAKDQKHEPADLHEPGEPQAEKPKPGEPEGIIEKPKPGEPQGAPEKPKTGEPQAAPARPKPGEPQGAPEKPKPGEPQAAPAKPKPGDAQGEQAKPKPGEPGYP